MQRFAVAVAGLALLGVTGAQAQDYPYPYAAPYASPYAGMYLAAPAVGVAPGMAPYGGGVAYMPGRFPAPSS